MAHKVRMTNDGFDYSLMDEGRPTMPNYPQAITYPVYQPSHMQQAKDPYRDRILNDMLEQYEDIYHAKRLEAKGKVRILINGEERMQGATEDDAKPSKTSIFLAIVFWGVIIALIIL